MTTATWLKTWQRFERALMTAPASYATLMAVTGWTRPTVQKYLDMLRDDKRVHVAEWGKDSRDRPVVPLFFIAPGKDAPRPGKASSAMRMHSDLQRYNLQNSRGELSLKQLASNRKRAKETMRVAIRAALNECALLSAARKP